MTIYDALQEAGAFIAARRQDASTRGLKAEEDLWRYWRDLRSFVHVTGQIYRFEDFRERALSTEPTGMSGPPGHDSTPLAQAAGALLRPFLKKGAESGHEKPVRTLLCLLQFISETGQLLDVDDFFHHQAEEAPVAIAHFSSPQEAENWLRSVPEPPSSALVLIGDAYYQLWYWREDQTRGLYRDYPIEAALEALVSQGIPPGTPAFSTRAEAEEWLATHPARPYEFVSISGEYHFAVHHRRLRRHTLSPVAMALKEWEDHKRAVDREIAQAAVTPPESGADKKTPG